MKQRPEVIPENYEAVYEYYDGLGMNQLVTRGLYQAMSLLTTPRVHYAQGAEAEINQLEHEGHSIVIVSTHQIRTDQNYIASAMKRDETLSHFIGKTHIWAKAPYFMHPIQRRLMDSVGAIPVFRDKELAENPKLKTPTTKRLMEVSEGHLTDGNNLFLFPEGTRNRQDRTQLGEIFGGIGRIAYEASQNADVAILPMAIWYGRGMLKHYRSPDIYVGMPQSGPFSSKRDGTQVAKLGLERCLAEVIAIGNQRNSERRSKVKDIFQ